jgi:hypothetical protein
MRWPRGRTAALAVVVGVVIGSAAPPAPAGADTVPASNSVTFFHDRWHPERTVVGSSAVFFRSDPPPRLSLSIDAVPSGAAATVQALIKNTSDSTVRFAAGVTIDAAVSRNGRSQGVWTLRDAGLRSLGPGQTWVVEASFALPKPGNYVVSATARY